MKNPFHGYTGRGVKVAIIDSGVNPSHPHVAGVAGGVRIGSEGDEDYLDHNGHGTAVAGAIREKAPDALLFALKVFDRRLTTKIESIINAILWTIEHNMMVINLSLGTANEAHREELQRAVDLATERNVAIVAAHNASGQRFLPGSMASVIGVEADPQCPRKTYRTGVVDGGPVLIASPYPRDIPGVPRERNLNGISFAVANMTGFVARAREMHPEISIASLKRLLLDQTRSAAWPQPKLIGFSL